jgi:hypothetical protein
MPWGCNPEHPRKLLVFDIVSLGPLPHLPALYRWLLVLRLFVHLNGGLCAKIFLWTVGSVAAAGLVVVMLAPAMGSDCKYEHVYVAADAFHPASTILVPR